MTCTSCQRQNLPGGVRCIYCGASLPVPLDFDLTPSSSAPSQTAAPGRQAGPTGQPQRRGLLGWLSAVGLFILKGKWILTLLKAKALLTLSSVFVFVWVDAKLFGWSYGLGIAGLIFVHEMGHVIVNWRKGLKQSAPMFIPLLGAVIFVKRFPDQPLIESESGAGGPAAGLLASLVCWAIAHATHSPFWLSLAYFGFLMNLFNLLPISPLDGGRVATVFSPRAWAWVLLALLLFVIKVGALLVIPIMGAGLLMRLGHDDHGRHLLAPASARLRMAVIYVVMCMALAYGHWRTEADLAALPHHGGRGLWVTRSTAATAPTATTSGLLNGRSTPLPPEQERYIRIVVLTVLFGTATLLWVLTALLVSRACGQKIGARAAKLAVVMVGLLWAVRLTRALPFVNPHEQVCVLGAYFAAAVGALVHAGSKAMRPQRVRQVTTWWAAAGGALTFAAGSALVVAYAFDSWLVPVAVALFAAAFYAMFPSLLFCAASGWMKDLGGLDRSLDYARRALRLRPEPEVAVFLATRVACIELMHGCGSRAIEALDLRENRKAAASGAASQQYPSISDLRLRATALALLDRPDEAVTCCERILQAPHDDPEAPLQLVWAHSLLGQVAAARGWSDEQVAQCDAGLKLVRRRTGPLIEGLQALRAAGLADAGRLEEACDACDAALAAGQSVETQAAVAAVRAAVSIRRGDGLGALTEADRALRAMPGSLNGRLRRAQALIAVGKRSEAQDILRRLAADYPSDHWGRQAAAELNRFGAHVTA